jgi:hypothetical protein
MILAQLLLVIGAGSALALVHHHRGEPKPIEVAPLATVAPTTYCIESIVPDRGGIDGTYRWSTDQQTMVPGLCP